MERSSSSSNNSSSKEDSNNNLSRGQELMRRLCLLNPQFASSVLEDYIRPIVRPDDVILEIECGANAAVMYLSRLCQGSKGPCIWFQDAWLTPNEFQYISGRETAKDWKRSIRHCGKSMKLLLTKGILTTHPPICDCEGCRISSPVNRVRLSDIRRDEGEEEEEEERVESAKGKLASSLLRGSDFNAKKQDAQDELVVKACHGPAEALQYADFIRKWSNYNAQLRQTTFPQFSYPGLHGHSLASPFALSGPSQLHHGGFTHVPLMLGAFKPPGVDLSSTQALLNLAAASKRSREEPEEDEEDEEGEEPQRKKTFFSGCRVNSLGCSEGTLRVSRWTVDDVCQFVARVDKCKSYPECIDGQSLLVLTELHLMNQLGLKLGPAINLARALSKEIGACQRCNHCKKCHTAEEEETGRS